MATTRRNSGIHRRKDGTVANDSTRHLSPAELAARYSVPLETVYGWNKTRTGPRFMKIGRHVRYRLADVIAWEDSRARGGKVTA
jgi:predicted DNA-binding transcriptional regulator AlpA